MHGWPAPLVQQVHVLARQFLAGGDAWIGVAGIERFGAGQRFPATRREGGRLEALGSHVLSRAFVWMQGADAELWVAPSDGGYRDIYDEFARTRLGLSGRPRGGFNIDHVFPKAAGVLDGLSHVRVLAIAATSNQSAGRTLEKAMKQRAHAAPGRKRVRHATWMTLGKATGFTGWERLPDGADPAGNRPLVDALFAHLAARGIVADFPGVEARLTAHTLTRIRYPAPHASIGRSRPNARAQSRAAS